MIIETIYKHRSDYIAKNYHEPRQIIMTHEQKRELKMNNADYMRLNPDAPLETFMGMLVHVARPELDMSDWLYYNGCIDVRNDNGV